MNWKLKPKRYAPFLSVPVAARTTISVKACMPGWHIEATAGITHATNTLYLIPFLLDRRDYINRIELHSPASSGEIRVGIYDADERNRPRTALFESQQTMIGGASMAINVDRFFEAGRYYAAYTSDTAFSQRAPDPLQSVAPCVTGVSTAVGSRSAKCVLQATGSVLPTNALPGSPAISSTPLDCDGTGFIWIGITNVTAGSVNQPPGMPPPKSLHPAPLRGYSSAITVYERPGWIAQSQVDNAGVTGSYFYLPISVDRETPYDAIGARTGATGGDIRLGLYTMNADGRPGTLLEDTGARTVAANTTLTVSINRILPAGAYFLCWIIDSGTWFMPQPAAAVRGAHGGWGVTAGTLSAELNVQGFIGTTADPLVSDPPLSQNPGVNEFGPVFLTRTTVP